MNKMIDKNLQKRDYHIACFLIFSFSFFLWIFLTNIYDSLFVYIFLFIFLLWFQVIFYFKNFFLFLIITLLGFFLWWLLSLYNLDIIKVNQNFLEKNTINFTKKISIIWEIRDFYSKNENYSVYILKINSLNKKISPWNINILINTNKQIKLRPWDIISFDQKIIKPESIDNFEYDKYLLLKEIYGQSFVYNFTKNWTNYSFIKNLIFNIKTDFINIINKIYPWDSAIFLGWILIWERTGFSKELKTNFNNSWLTHIIAISWFNITIIVIFLSFILKFFPNYIKLPIISLAIILFTLIVWCQIPILRASLMWLVSYYFLTFWKKANWFSLLIFIVLIFSLFNPLILNYDISFYLSFLAVLWILYTQDFFKKILKYLPDLFVVKETLIMTLSSLVFTIPIVAVNFGQISIISPVTNILATPVIPITMLFWTLSIIFYLIYSQIWIWIWFLTWVLLEYVLFIVNFFWSMSFSIIKTDLWIYRYVFEIIYYLILVFLILYFKKDVTKKIS